MENEVDFEAMMEQVILFDKTGKYLSARVAAGEGAVLTAEETKNLVESINQLAETVLRDTAARLGL